MGKPNTSPPSNDMKDNELKRGPWTPDEDKKLVDYISKNGHGKWRTLPKNAGLRRCGKSCRLRWINYLRPDVKRGGFSPEEEEIIMQLQSVLGNRWSAIAARLPGRTDNEIKNYWNTRIKKRIRLMGIDSMIHTPYFGLMNGFPMLGSSLCSLAESGIDLSQFTDASSLYLQEDRILPQYTSPSDHFLENRQMVLGNVHMQDVHSKFLPFQDYHDHTEARNDNQQLDCLIPSSYLYPQIITQRQRTDCQDKGFCFESTNLGRCESLNTSSSRPSTSLVVRNNHTENDGGRLYSDNVLFTTSSADAHVPNNCFEFLSI